MFEKKVKEEEQSKIVPIEAKDIGLPYTELTIDIDYTLANGKAYNCCNYFYLSNYTSYPTANEAIEALKNDYLETLNKYKEQIAKNFGKYEGYMQFGDLFIRTDQCTTICIKSHDNSGPTSRGSEYMPSVKGWPWEVGSYHAE